MLNATSLPSFPNIVTVDVVPFLPFAVSVFPINIAPPLLRHGLMSLGRFSSAMFPAFAWLAWRVRGRARTRLIVACAVGQAVLAALFFTWRALF